MTAMTWPGSSLLPQKEWTEVDGTRNQSRRTAGIRCWEKSGEFQPIWGGFSSVGIFLHPLPDLRQPGALTGPDLPPQKGSCILGRCPGWAFFALGN